MSRVRSAVLILAILTIAGVPTELLANSEISCSSVRTPDLKDARINGIKFRHGKAYTSDGTNPKDWEHTFSMDRILNPVPGKELRLVVIHSNHLAGSGAWDTVMVFDCVRGRIKEIFERKYLYGVKVETKTGNELSLSSGDWQPDDPMCCPSKVKKEIYRWNENKGTYTLKRTVTRKTK